MFARFIAFRRTAGPELLMRCNQQHGWRSLGDRPLRRLTEHESTRPAASTLQSSPAHAGLAFRQRLQWNPSDTVQIALSAPLTSVRSLTTLGLMRLARQPAWHRGPALASASACARLQAPMNANPERPSPSPKPS